jgi:hypothetical protein
MVLSYVKIEEIKVWKREARWMAMAKVKKDGVI